MGGWKGPHYSATVAVLYETILHPAETLLSTSLKSRNQLSSSLSLANSFSVHRGCSAKSWRSYFRMLLEVWWPIKSLTPVHFKGLKRSVISLHHSLYVGVPQRNGVGGYWDTGRITSWILLPRFRSFRSLKLATCFPLISDLWVAVCLRVSMPLIKFPSKEEWIL